MLINQSLKNYLKKLASESPTPGGGSASALVAALGTSLILMVARVVFQKKNAKNKRLKRSIEYLMRVLCDIEEIVDLDSQVYEAVIKSYRDAKKKKGAPPARKRIETALANSFRLQADLAMLIVMAKETLPFIDSLAKTSIRSDLLVARGFLDGAFYGAVATARINLIYMTSSRKEHFSRGLERLEKRYVETKKERAR